MGINFNQEEAGLKTHFHGVHDACHGCEHPKCHDCDFIVDRPVNENESHCDCPHCGGCHAKAVQTSKSDTEE